MLSLFPSLFAYGLFAPLLIRLVLGIILAHWGYRVLRSHQKSSTSTTLLAIVDVVAGILLIIGLFTQFATLVAAIVLAVKLVNKARSKALFTDGVNYYFILFVMAVSLLFTGPGFLAFDLPL